MIEWALIAFAATFPIATAAVKMHAAHLKHKKWAHAQAQECFHVWREWAKDEVTKVWSSPPGSNPRTRHIRHKRTCEMCGDIDYKTWDTAKSAWLNT